jgi:hypothetical protein
MSKLKLIRGLSDLEMRVGDRVTFKDESKVPGTTHGPDNDKKVVVKTFSVTETQTILDVLWQDGIKETLLSKELIPYLNPDEYDCWCVGSQLRGCMSHIYSLQAGRLRYLVKRGRRKTSCYNSVCQRSRSYCIGAYTGDWRHSASFSPRARPSWHL